MMRVLVKSLILLALGTLVLPAPAQYKWRTAEGTTVYSDVPPPTGARLMNERAVQQPVPPAADSSDAGSAGVELPYELKLVNAKFPVALYTAPECAPCAAARQHLAARGVPFSEKSIVTSADFDAFKTRGFSENSFPAITVGREKAVGFEAGVYDRLLTAAGYPRTSKLPATYRQAAAEPLTPREAQRMTVSVQRQSQPVQESAAAADNLTAIERYRQQAEAAAPKRPAGIDPSIRF